ncbi:pentatricopeptide repeat-containing protein At3g49170, chloroplastic [Humulus lupulus]|uniref:pentatricopeptide repeat-containing protein At3g49170, chloroplastic n=1 Tax=Humulus lupulus TaxID=3486 RepID=UPI002B40DA49|nr:pentatricopeptide repeat-containing protein At3g49170, chloroplastic [Humulus lupulus]
MMSLASKLALPPFLRPQDIPKPPNPKPPLPFNFKTLQNRLVHNLNVGHLQNAISTLDLMVDHGVHPELSTYSFFLKSCIRSRNFELGKLVHAQLVDLKLELDSVILNSLISLYSKIGDWVKANAIFESMGKKRNLVSWTAIISCFANNGMGYEAILTFVDMVENGFFPNEYCFAAVIRACSIMEYVSIGKTVFGSIIKSGYFESDLFVGCSLIDMFAKGSGDLVAAYKVFGKMPEKNGVTWTLMITRLAQSGCAREAIDLFLEMILSEVIPDQFTFSTVISACSELELLEFGKQLHSQVVRYGLDSDNYVSCCLVDMYAKCEVDGSMDESRKLFDQMPNHNVLSWTALITGYVQNGRHSEEAIKLFCEMISAHVQPNHFTFSSILKACANLSDLRTGKQVHALAEKLGLASVNCVGNSLISMYAQFDQMKDSRKAFDILFDKNLISYNTIVDAYARNLDLDKAFDLFHELDNMGFEASPFAFSSLLSGVASIGAIGKGEQIHARLLKSGQSNQISCNALISMYSRCGNIEAAFQVFNKMEDRNIVSWTSIITGFSKHGFADRALALLHEMLESGITPNEITFTAVLSACSHTGLVSEGWKHFKSMYPKHGIVPRMEHYACMVDLLGRSGSLSEAHEFINSMPFMADTLIWRTFLGACRVHGNIELGKQAANMILKLDPNEPAAFVLLANLYASTNQWEEVAQIRKKMKEKNLIKEAGSSWIEVENKVYKFHVGDTSNPQSLEIYDELDRLASKIKELGFVPNTDLVLHDVKEEQKERYLFQHSEKIAVAFGLINTSKSKPVRVFKNLRICGDCHSAIKYISVATEREIVVRDSNRFHHIKNGNCSCNDYW